jgi:hypothetical protein
MDWLLNFLMGQDIDIPITAWQEMFLPQAIGDRVSGFRYVDALGTERNLVSNIEAVNRAVKRPPVLERPRRQWIWELAFGLCLALLLALPRLFLRRRYPGLWPVLWGLAQALLGLFFGLAGSVLFFMTFFSDHDYTWHNINILFVNPLWFAALVWGLRCAFPREGRGPGRRERAVLLLRWFWTVVFVLCFLTMPLKLLPAFYQQNQVTQALILPLAFVLSWFPLVIAGALPRK